MVSMPIAPREQCCSGGGQRTLWASMTADTPTHAERRIAGKTVGHIHRRMCVIVNRSGQRRARLWQAITADQHLTAARHRRERSRAAPENIETRRASPIVPVTTTRSPGFAPLRWTIFLGEAPERRDRDHVGPGVDTVSPPSSGQPNCAASSPSPRERLEHASSRPATPAPA